VKTREKEKITYYVSHYFNASRFLMRVILPPVFFLSLNMEKFVGHLVQLIETERKIDVEETMKLLSSYAPIQLQKRGVALVGLKVTGIVIYSVDSVKSY
jgi:hypothetical protein